MKAKASKAPALRSLGPRRATTRILSVAGANTCGSEDFSAIAGDSMHLWTGRPLLYAGLNATPQAPWPLLSDAAISERWLKQR